MRRPCVQHVNELLAYEWTREIALPVVNVISARWHSAVTEVIVKLSANTSGRANKV